MQPYPINMARKAQIRLEAQRLSTELKTWLGERRDKDEQKQYYSQLNSIEDLIGEALADLRPDIDALDPAAVPGTFYASCRLIDLRIIWLRRVWQFFKEKFDQRDDKLFGPMLRAADEVVWSCYRQIFTSAPSLKQGPAPLPFIEAQFSPEAFPAELVPASLRDKDIGAAFLRTYLNKLPTPVVRLPPTCVVAPWWLVYVGHEIGHHIQFDLDLVDWFREAVKQAIEAKGGNASDVKNWGNWSKEIFADIFSVLVMGPWAVTAMIELELDKPAAMRERRPSYPSPLIRLKLLADTADRLGVNGEARTRDYDLDLEALTKASSETSKDAGFIEPVLDIALGPLSDLPFDLPDLVMFRPEEFQTDGPVDEWCKAFLTEQDYHISNNGLRAARLMTSATLRAWSEITMRSDEEIAMLAGKGDRTARYATLASRALDVIVRSREEGTRDKVPQVKVGQFGKDLARVLREADRTELEGGKEQRGDLAP